MPDWCISSQKSLDVRRIRDLQILVVEICLRSRHPGRGSLDLIVDLLDFERRGLQLELPLLGAAVPAALQTDDVGRTGTHGSQHPESAAHEIGDGGKLTTAKLALANGKGATVPTVSSGTAATEDPKVIASWLRY